MICTTQQKIIHDYYQNCGRSSLRIMANDLGLRKTRLHRILNGQEMKISEYELFRTCIYKSMGKKSSSSQLLTLAGACSEQLSQKCIDDLEDLMMRKLNLKTTLLGKYHE